MHDCIVCRSTDGDSCTSDTMNSSRNDLLYDLSDNERIGIYGGIVSSFTLLVLFRTILGFLICLAAARNLHNKMFKAILRTPILFFDTNPLGIPLNNNYTVEPLYNGHFGTRYSWPFFAAI